MGIESKTRKTHRTIEQIQTCHCSAPVKQAFNILQNFSLTFKVNLSYVIKKIIRIHIKKIVARRGLWREKGLRTTEFPFLLTSRSEVIKGFCFAIYKM